MWTQLNCLQSDELKNLQSLENTDYTIWLSSKVANGYDPRFSKSDGLNVTIEASSLFSTYSRMKFFLPKYFAASSGIAVAF